MMLQRCSGPDEALVRWNAYALLFVSLYYLKMLQELSPAFLKDPENEAHPPNIPYTVSILLINYRSLYGQLNPFVVFPRIFTYILGILPLLSFKI